MNQRRIEKILIASERYGIVLKSHIVLNSGIECLLFGSPCPSDLFYLHFFRVAIPALKVYHNTSKFQAMIKRILLRNGCKKVWSKGIFSFYGDLRPLAKLAGFGDYSADGLILNQELGNDFLLTAVFFER